MIHYIYWDKTVHWYNKTLPVYPCKSNFVIQFNYLLASNTNERNNDSYNTIITTTVMKNITVYMYILYQ
jgi:hypothetical protein